MAYTPADDLWPEDTPTMITAEKLQIMADNDDWLYQQAILRPKGILNFATTGTQTDDTFFDLPDAGRLTVNVEENNRILGIFFALPSVRGNDSAQISRNCYFRKFSEGGFGTELWPAYHSQTLSNTSTTAQVISIFLAVYDRVDRGEYTYQVVNGYVIQPLGRMFNEARAGQFWIEDLGDAMNYREIS